jgi:hypothetical protein
MIFLNINDGTGNIACQINPETYEKYSALLEDIKKKPVVVLGETSRDGRKIHGSMLQIANGNSGEIFSAVARAKECEIGQAIIYMARPAVSKNNKSYYRVALSDGTEGLCFRFADKLFPGMKVQGRMTEAPFINLKVLK